MTAPISAVAPVRLLRWPRADEPEFDALVAGQLDAEVRAPADEVSITAAA